MIQLFVATKAFITYQGNLLVLRESKKYGEGTHAGFFDVVGGRMTPGENVHDCLKREVVEETGLDVKIGTPFFVSEWHPIIKGIPSQIVGIFFHCQAASDKVHLSQDHSEYKWISPLEFRQEQLIPNLHAAFEAFIAL